MRPDMARSRVNAKLGATCSIVANNVGRVGICERFVALRDVRYSTLRADLLISAPIRISTVAALTCFMCFANRLF